MRHHLVAKECISRLSDALSIPVTAQEDLLLPPSMHLGCGGRYDGSEEMQKVLRLLADALGPQGKQKQLESRGGACSVCD